MNMRKRRNVLLAGIAAVAVGGCERAEQLENSNLKDGRTEIAVETGVNEPWGQNPSCTPKGCPPKKPAKEDTAGSSETISQEEADSVKYEPEYLGLLHINLGKNNDIQAAHALYDLKACKAAFPNQPAFEVLLDAQERRGTWPSKGNCQPIPEGTGVNFSGMNYFGQTDIFIDVDGLQSKIDGRHPILFTKYSAGDLNTKMTKNFSFYEAALQANSTQNGDELLYMKNYFTHKSKNKPWRKLKVPADRKNPKNPRRYSMNIHLLSGSAKIPLIVDPDTGNGSDD